MVDAGVSSPFSEWQLNVVINPAMDLPECGNTETSMALI